MTLGDGSVAPVRLEWLETGNPLEVLAVIHATVDLERTLADLGVAPARAAGSASDELLGARVLVVGEATPLVAVAEPSTEGRLAAALARHGEGVVGAYVRSPLPLSRLRDRAAAAGIVLSRRAPGPFGDEVLVVGSGLGGRQEILVEPGRVPSAR